MARNKKQAKKLAKRIFKSTERFKPFDGTHGFKLKKEFFDDGYKLYKLVCVDCDTQLDIHLFPDKAYPHIEIGGVLLGWETAERIFAEIFHNNKNNI